MVNKNSGILNHLCLSSSSISKHNSFLSPTYIPTIRVTYNIMAIFTVYMTVLIYEHLLLRIKS